MGTATQSPVVAPQATIVTSVAQSKATVLTVLSASGPKPTASPNMAASLQAADLSEQFNGQIKEKYVKGKKIGEGTYAVVFVGHVKDDPSQKVAIKKIKVNENFKEGLNIDAIREVKILQEMSHPNVIALLDVFSSKNQNLNIVLEFLAGGDLEQLIKDTSITYGLADMKAWMGMIARGVWWCHENFVLHRDIKPNNLFIGGDGEIKLADFGLARTFAEPNINMTNMVITRWYRPPELFFGAKHYSGAVDVWSVGCVFAELSLRRPFLPSDTDQNHISLMSQALGAPSEKNWPGVSKLPYYLAPSDSPAFAPVDWSQVFRPLGADGQDLLKAMLVLDPRKRITARGTLQHRWFVTGQKPAKKENLPRKGAAEAKEALANELKRRAGEVDGARADKVAKKLDFGAAR